MTLYVSGENLQLYDKLLKEYILTKSESLLDLLSYGVRWEKELKDPHLTRIGNLNWHRTLPLQSQMRGCIVLSPSKGIHIVKYWLHPDDWRFRKDNAGYVFNSEVSTIVENDTTYYTITDSTRFSDLGYKRLYVKINGIIGLIIDITDNTAKIKLENTLDAGTYEIELGSRTNGYDGEVMVYMPGGYLHSVDAPTYSEVRISPFNVGGDWEYHKPGYISAYRITVLNEVPTDMGYLSTIPVNSAISVANVETYCRGGDNRPEYDLYLETDPFRSDLGKGFSNGSIATARTYARNCNSEILNYFNYKWLCWLYVIEYANFNSQEAFNSELTSEGFKLGGMGDALTSLPYNYLTIYNNCGLVCPNGYLSQIGNNTNILEFKIYLPTSKEETEYKSYTLYPFSYRGIENLFGDTYLRLEGIVVKARTYTDNDNIYHSVYTTNNPLYYGDTIDNKEFVGLVNGTAQGVITEFDLKNNANIFPLTIINKGSLSTYKCDGVWAERAKDGLKGTIVGGPSYYGATCGLFFWHNNGETYSYGIGTIYRSFKELSMESIVITSDSNAPLMTAMYNAGLASNPNYMTKSEAEKVTTLSGIDFTNVVSFDEFKYFTGVTEIPNACFLKNTSLTSIICPDSLITIGDHAFAFCSNLVYVKIGKYVTSIDNYAFGNSGLKTITIPNSVTSIGNGAFSISKLTSITIPSSVTSIGDSLFSYCAYLGSIVVESDNPVYDSRDNCNAIIETATNKLLLGCKNTIIPNLVTAIDRYAFTGQSLTLMIIPDSVTSIGGEAFGECGRLTSITIPNSVTTIGGYAFQYCTSLTSIVIGNSITSIGDGTFRNCYSLSSIKCLATTAPTVESVTFGDSDTNYTGLNTRNQGVNKLYIPTGATGYDTGYWADPLQNASKCGFTIEYIDNN